MASQIQSIVGKGIPNLLIADDLLKFLRILIISSKISYPFPFTEW